MQRGVSSKGIGVLGSAMKERRNGRETKAVLAVPPLPRPTVPYSKSKKVSDL